MSGIRLEGSAGSQMLLIADHASNHVPDDIDLGVDAALLDEHVALDIGADALTRAAARMLDCPAILGAVSRLVVDLHRRRDEANAIPVQSDGHDIPANQRLTLAEREGRLARFWDPYHALLSERIEALRPLLLVGVHSFTPRLRTRPEEKRPWEVGILYNRDERAARIALGLLGEVGIAAGDNEPYSGKLLNATMDRHAEARGLPYIVFEVRQDLIADEAGAQDWARRLVPIIRGTCEALA